MVVERKIDRELTLDSDEIRKAIWYYLGDKLDQPIPEEASDLTLIASDPAVAKIKVTWTEHALIDTPDASRR